MSNKNHKLNNGSENTNPENNSGEEQRKPLIQVNWRKVAKTGGKIVIGFCALIGAAGIGSYAADQIGKPKVKPQIPESTATIDNQD